MPFLNHLRSHFSLLVRVTQETLILAKKFPAASFRILVMAFAMIYGVYICSLCFTQINHVHAITTPKLLLSVEVNPKPTSYNRSGCGCKPERLFAIVSMQRSGSRWVETLLNNHSDVSSNGEIFYGEDRRSNASAVISTLDKVFNLEWMAKNHCSPAVGFKWMLNQGLMEYHKEIREYFKRKDVYVIFIFRRNLLRRMVSLLANIYDTNAKLIHGQHKAHVQSRQEAAILSRYKPAINTTTLIVELKLMEKMIEMAFQYFNSTSHIVLYYEDLIKNPPKMMEVQEFLGLRKMELSSRNVKIHSGSLSKHIKNWEKVSKILRGTSYETFLHADYTN